MTGEMSMMDLKKGGEHYEWGKTMMFAAFRLQRMTKKAITFKQVRSYDVYQGPYAQLNYGRLWSGDHPNHFFYEGMGIDIQGTLREIADEINAHIASKKKSA